MLSIDSRSNFLDSSMRAACVCMYVCMYVSYMDGHGSGLDHLLYFAVCLHRCRGMGFLHNFSISSKAISIYSLFVCVRYLGLAVMKK